MTPPTGTGRAFPIGKVLITAAALIPAVGTIAADWSVTHLFNPDWTPHAKFHTAQTMTTAVTLAALSSWQLWKPGPDSISQVRWATLLGGLYWFTQVPAAFFPGSALVDPDSLNQPFTTFGIPINQVTVTAAVVLPLLAAGLALESRRLDDATMSPTRATTAGSAPAVVADPPPSDLIL